MIWFTSDLHFGHAQVIQYSHRPFKDLEDMHQQLISNWNKKVSSHDTIYVLGDIALCPFREFKPICEQLKGNKILIQGNHDKYSIGQYEKLGFSVYQELKIKMLGRNFRLSHYPYWLPWYRRPFAYASELRFEEKRPPRIKDEILLHGHTHTKYRWIPKQNRLHVGVDAWSYCPVSLPQIESLISKQME